MQESSTFYLFAFKFLRSKHRDDPLHKNRDWESKIVIFFLLPNQWQEYHVEREWIRDAVAVAVAEADALVVDDEDDEIVVVVVKYDLFMPFEMWSAIETFLTLFQCRKWK